MRNKETISETIFSAVKKLPYFTFVDLAGMAISKTYLKILLSRYEKAGMIIRLKKGLYAAKEYLDEIKRREEFVSYSELTANLLCQPSYLSLDYVLYQHNLLTEVPVNFTSITLNKTTSFSNKLGNFFYHKIKVELFCGFAIVKKSDFNILKASKAKAIFDFLYLRKNLIVNRSAFDELRINKENLSREDLKELKKHILLEGSKKMKDIFDYFK